MTLNIQHAGTDLSSIFANNVSGGNIGTITNAATTHIQSGGADLSTLLGALAYGSAQSSSVVIETGGADLKTVFAALGTTSYKSEYYNVAATYTETIPTGAVTVTIEVFGGSGNGGAGNGGSCTGRGGGGGGSGGYAKSTYNVAGKGGQTMTVYVGSIGGNSNVISGTFTMTAMGTGGGQPGGAASGGVAGAGGAAGSTGVGGTVTNSAGNPGSAGQSGAIGGAGGAGVTGTYASGLAGGAGASYGSQPVGSGHSGVVIFHYVA
jgi:hypothetical protein